MSYNSEIVRNNERVLVILFHKQILLDEHSGFANLADIKRELDDFHGHLDSNQHSFRLL